LPKSVSVVRNMKIFPGYTKVRQSFLVVLLAYSNFRLSSAVCVQGYKKE
jgi:hypothetical protein